MENTIGLDPKPSLDGLINDLIDAEGTARAIEVGRQLETQLLDSPEAQTRYLSAMNLHLELQSEMGKPTADDAASGPPKDHFAGAASEFSPDHDNFVAVDDFTEANQPDPRRLSGVERLSRVERWRSPMVAVAAVLLVGLGMGLMASFDRWPSTHRGGETIADQRANRHGDLAIGPLGVREPATLQRISRVTRTSAITRLDLPRAKGRLASGTAWLRRAARADQSGYVQCLAPGQKMNVAVDANALIYNSLSIIELDGEGLATGNQMFFSNLPETETPRLDWVSKPRNLGQYVVTNDSPADRFFLFAAAHVGQSGAVSGLWNQSDFEVKYRSSSLLVVGWDDMGTTAINPDGETGIPDRDFDDMRAIVTIDDANVSTATGDSFSSTPWIVHHDDIESDRAIELTVRPKQRVVAIVSSTTRQPVRLRVTTSSDGQVRWQPAAGNLLFDKNKTPLSGTAVLRAIDGRETSYRIVGQQRSVNESEDDWFDSPVQIVQHDEQTLTAEFPQLDPEPDNVGPRMTLHLRRIVD